MSRLCRDFTFTWIVNNYSFIDIKNSVRLSSPFFTTRNIVENEFQIGASIKTVDSEEYVSLFLYRQHKQSSEAVALDVEMELCNSKDELLCITDKKRGMKFHTFKEYTFENVILLNELDKKINDGSDGTLVLRCRMWARSNSEVAEKTLSRYCTAETTECLDEISYMRAVNYTESSNWSVELPFLINGNEYLLAKITATQDEVQLEINLLEKAIFPKIKCKIILLDKKGTEIISRAGFFKFSEKIRCWQFFSHLKKSSFPKGTRSLRLKFNFTFSNALRNTNIIYGNGDETKNLKPTSSFVDFQNITQETDCLKDDLRKMLFSEEHADVSFCIDSEIISAHKCILAIRSPVFSAMFNQQMAENETGVINITDMDVLTLKLFLKFLYTGMLLDQDWEKMLELLLAAEKYQVQSLKERCAQSLKQQLSIDNVCDVVSVADKVNERTLKLAAMDYIKHNYTAVFSSPKWSVFIKNHVELCAEILNIFSDNLKAV